MMDDIDDETTLGDIYFLKEIEAQEVKEEIDRILIGAATDPALSGKAQSLSSQGDVFRVKPTAKTGIEGVAAAVAILVGTKALTTATGLVVKDLYEYVKAKLKDRYGPSVKDISDAAPEDDKTPGG